MVRIATWNLWWRFGPWEERAPAIESTLLALDADVLCLQETWVEARGSRQVDRLAEVLGAHAVTAELAGTDDVGIANAVISRWPILRADTVALPGLGAGPSRRHALVAHVDAPFGRLQVVSTHLHHQLSGGSVRVAQARALAELVAGLWRPEAFPVVVGGDLNAVPWSDEVRLLTGASPSPVADLAFTDCWEHAGDGSTGHTWRAANPYLASSAMPNRRIDYLLVSWPRPRPVGNPARCWLTGLEPVDGVHPSDHAAVVADLITPAGGDVSEEPAGRSVPDEEEP